MVEKFKIVNPAEKYPYNNISIALAPSIFSYPSLCTELR
jgi:hypothetical protein